MNVLDYIFLILMFVLIYIMGYMNGKGDFK